MQVDTHVHFWKYEKVKDAWITDNMKILQQDYLPANHFFLLQTEWDRWLCGCAGQPG